MDLSGNPVCSGSCTVSGPQRVLWAALPQFIALVAHCLQAWKAHHVPRQHNCVHTDWLVQCSMGFVSVAQPGFISSAASSARRLDLLLQIFKYIECIRGGAAKYCSQGLSQGRDGCWNAGIGNTGGN